MNNKQVFELTLDGKRELENELEHLKSVDRPQNIIAIQEARSQGDLSENADYTAAREEQGRIEARIFEIENILKNVKLIEADKSNKVSTGKTVVLEYVALGKEFTYDLVGTIEADPFAGKISNDSPLGNAIIGHKKGDKVTFVTGANLEQTVIIKDVK